METRDKFRQMVKYLLNGEPTKDAKTIDNYTDSLMLGCQQYHEEQAELVCEQGNHSHNLDVLHLGCCTKCGGNKIREAI